MYIQFYTGIYCMVTYAYDVHRWWNHRGPGGTCPPKIISEQSEPTTSGVNFLSYIVPMCLHQYYALRKNICFVAPLIRVHDDVLYSYPRTSSRMEYVLKPTNFCHPDVDAYVREICT